MAGVVFHVLKFSLLLGMSISILTPAHGASIPIQDLQLTLQYFPNKAPGRNFSLAKATWLKVCDQFSKRFRVQNGNWGSGAFTEVKCWDGTGAKPVPSSWNLIITEDPTAVRFQLYSTDLAKIQGGAQTIPDANLILSSTGWKLEYLLDGVFSGRIIAALTDQLPVFARLEAENIDLKNGTFSLVQSSTTEKAEPVTTLPSKIVLYGLLQDSNSGVYRAHVHGEATLLSPTPKNGNSPSRWKLGSKWESATTPWVWIHNREGRGRISPEWKILSQQRLKELEFKSKKDQDELDAMATSSSKNKEPPSTSPILGAYYGFALESRSFSTKKGFYIGLFKESGIVPTTGFLFNLNHWKMLSSVPQFSVDFNLSDFQVAWAWNLNWTLGIVTVSPMPVLRFSILRTSLYEGENKSGQSLGAASTNIVAGGGGLLLEAPFTKLRVRSVWAYEYGLYASGSENSFWGAQARLEVIYSPDFCAKIQGKFSCALSSALILEQGSLKNKKTTDVDKKYSLAVLNIKYAVSFLAFGIGVWW